MPPAARRRWRLHIRALAVLVAAGLLPPLLAALAQAALAWRDARTYPPPGRLLSVGSHRLHLHCTGEGPTVLLAAGMGSLSAAWAWVERDLAPSARVCAWDRAGTGWSEDSAAQHDAVTAAEELHRLVAAAELPTPAILVGHSYGGMVIRAYQALFPAAVAGLVLVDSSHPEMGERFPPRIAAGFRDLLAGFASAERASRFGLTRVLGRHRELVATLPEEVRRGAAARFASVAHWRGAAAEAGAWGISSAAVREERDLGDLPIAVLTVDGWPEDMLPVWHELQRELASLSSSSTFEIVRGADHAGIAQDPRFAPRVVAAVRDVLARSGLSSSTGASQ